MKTDWEKRSSSVIKAEMARYGISYDELKRRLEKLGVNKTKANITKTINLGKFSFSFFMQCMIAMDAVRDNGLISFMCPQIEE